MIQAVAVGSFAIGTVTGNLSITGVGFQPDAVVFFSNAASADNLLQNGLLKAVTGAAVSSSSQWCISTHSEDGSTGGDTGQSQYGDRCIQFLNDAEGDDGHATFTSMDVDGFSINRVVASAFSNRVGYMAFKGFSVEINSFSVPATPQSVAYTTPFPPDFLMFAGIGASTTTAVDSRRFVGFACREAGGAVGNLVWAGGSDNAANPTDTKSYCRSGECIAMFDTVVDTINQIGAVTAFSDTGFTINHSQTVSGRTVYYLALGGGKWKSGSILTRTDTTSQSVTGVGFRPIGGIFMGAMAAEDLTDTPHDHDKWSFAVTSNQSGVSASEAAYFDQDNVATSDMSRMMDNSGSDVIGDNQDAASLIGWPMLDSWDADGFTWHMADADTGANFIGYMVLGQTDWIPKTHTNMTRMLRRI